MRTLEPDAEPGMESDEALARPRRGGSRSKDQAGGLPRQAEEDCAAALGMTSLVVPAGEQNSTARLARRLSRLRGHGVRRPRAFLRAAGPFPVAGPATWADDWLAPRCEPYPHRHRGLDIFASQGTPLVAAVAGEVSQLAVRAIGGLSVEITAPDGVQYFYAHLSSFADGLRVGSRVRTGEVIGYVGDTGNARGTPHLHLEIQPGGIAVPPKPYVDRWLRRAEDRAARWARALAGRRGREEGAAREFLAALVLDMPAGYVEPDARWSASDGRTEPGPRHLLLMLGRPLARLVVGHRGPLAPAGDLAWLLDTGGGLSILPAVSWAPSFSAPLISPAPGP